MAEVTVRSVEGFRVEASGAGHAVTIDESREAGGTGLGMAPQEALATALASCAAITMTMYARRKGWPLQRVSVRAAIEPSSAPDRPHRIVQTIFLEGPLDDEQRTRLKVIAGKCPVHKIVAGPTVLEERLG